MGVEQGWFFPAKEIQVSTAAEPEEEFWFANPYQGIMRYYGAPGESPGTRASFVVQGKWAPEGGRQVAETDWQARYLDKLERDVAELKAEFRAAEARIGARIDQFLGEVRHLDEQRRAEIEGLRQDIRSELQEVKAENRETRKEVRNLVIATFIGVGAMVLAVVAIVVSVILKG